MCVCASNVPKSAASHCRDPKLVCPLPFSSPSVRLATQRLCELRRTHIFKYFKLHAPSPSYPTVPYTYCSSPVPIQHYPTPALHPIPMPLLWFTHSSILSCQFQFHFSISSSPKVSLKFLKNVWCDMCCLQPSSLASTTRLSLVGCKCGCVVRVWSTPTNARNGLLSTT